ncbi:hypothetical protein DP49_1180 [Burkholderia pseudomallei]|nr:hypothetical protein DP62_5752 [Burkholderia pseudomallei]KGD55226.1 hypothetical protein DP49_1180 [Burkholderia pseudomallei]KGS72588.1 hypothetical protein X942_6071 [Burkholderia pseudomallei MSHR5596]
MPEADNGGQRQSVDEQRVGQNYERRCRAGLVVDQQADVPDRMKSYRA